MTNGERKQIIMMAWLKAISKLMLIISIVGAWYGDLVLAGFLLIARSALNLLDYDGLAYFIFWVFCGLGILLLGYGKSFFALGPLALAAVILVADIILWIRAIKRDGMRGLLRIKITAGRPKMYPYARRDFYEENEITCILWNKLKKNRIGAESGINGVGNVQETKSTMTNDERKKFIKFILTEAISFLLFILGFVCILFEKFVWAGILFSIVGIVNTFFWGLPASVLIFIGFMIISLGYEKRELGMIFGAVGLIAATTNLILWLKSLASGGLERLQTLAKSNRFAFFDYSRENEITFVLWNKLKRRLNWTKTEKNNREGE